MMCSAYKHIMAQERPNRLVEWLAVAREHWPEVRRGISEWTAQVREEPQLIWATPAVRYAVYGTGALLAAWFITFAIGLITPPLPAAAKPQATTADYHVLCTNPACGHHFIINRKFGFRGFPVDCSKCGKNTGAAARQCNSPTCRGKWIVPKESPGQAQCPVCGAIMN